MSAFLQSSVSGPRGRSPEALSPNLFTTLIEDCQKREPIPVAVCWPCSDVSLAGAVEAAEAGLIEPVADRSAARDAEDRFGAGNQP